MNKNKADLKMASISSQIQQPQLPNSFAIEKSVESSIQNLIRNWYRRQKWKLFLNPTEEEELNKAKWRTNLSNFLESKPVSGLAIFLLILDLILTTLDLSSSLISCHPNKNKLEKDWYHWAGITILSLLSARIVALAAALGGSFFGRLGYVVDGVVLVGALVLEAFLEGKGGGFLVVVSLWRVVRVVESAFELSDEAIEAQIEGVLSEFEVLREENRRLSEMVAAKDKEIERLREDLDQYQQDCHSS